MEVEPEFHSAVKVSSEGQQRSPPVKEPLTATLKPKGHRPHRGLQWSWPAVTFTEEAGPDWHIHGDLCKIFRMLEASTQRQGQKKATGKGKHERADSQ